ncbi:MAG: FAD-dependent oxidoreductase [Acidimicrobiia bacterium]
MVTERADVVVVGAGLLGLATAWALRGRREVLVLEQATIGHARGGSHGPSRVFRFGYADALYVRLAQLALPRWRALEAETGTPLLDVTGQLTFGAGAEPVAAALSEAGAPAQRLSAAEVVAAFPMFAGHGPALYEPGSGVIAAAATLAALCTAATCDVREECAVTAIIDGEPVRVETLAGAISANVVVLTAGPWTGALCPDLVPAGTNATREHVAYLQPKAALEPHPIFVDFSDPAVYGLPTPGSDLYKIALHHGGEVIDPQAPADPPPARAVAALEAAARAWLPAYEPVAVEVDTCIYDNTPNEDFVLHRAGNVVVGAGTSGHGFKFGPLLGELLASLVTGTEPSTPLERFALHC